MIPLLEENGELSTGAASKSWIFVIVIVCLFLIAPFLSAVSCNKITCNPYLKTK